MTPPSLRLLNCTHCDDVVKLVDKERICECGMSRGSDSGAEVRVSGPARVLAIEWEVYDGLAEGIERPFRVLPKAQLRAKGGL